MKKIFAFVSLGVSLFISGCCCCDVEPQYAKAIAYGTLIQTGNDNLDKALAYIASCDLSHFKDGVYKIEDDKIYMTVSDNDLRDEALADLEAHKKYADIQILIRGSETFGLGDTSKCKTVSVPYSAEKDIEFYKDAPTSYETVSAGQMIILLPQHAHMPLLGKGKVRKCVVKVLIED